MAAPPHGNRKALKLIFLDLKHAHRQWMGYTYLHA